MPPNDTTISTPAALLTSEHNSSRPQTPSHPRALTPLSYLSSPVPDLAATLHTQASEDADEANVMFLRSSLDSLERAYAQHSTEWLSRVDVQRDPRRAVPPPPGWQAGQQRRESTEDLSRWDRLQRVLARLHRMHEPPSSSPAAYSNRSPSPHRQSLYDWAPANDDRADRSEELNQIVAEVRREQPETQSESLRVLRQNQLRERDNSLFARTEAQDSADDHSGNRSGEQLSERRRELERINLRNRAVLQRARQESSPSSTDRMLRYISDRERSGMSEEEYRARGIGWFRPNPTTSTTNAHTGPQTQMHTDGTASATQTPLVSSRASEIRDRDRQERVEAFRRGYLPESMPPRLPGRTWTPLVPQAPSDSRHSNVTPAPPPLAPHQQHQSDRSFLENALKYLSSLRNCHSYEDALACAIDHGLATKEFFADKHDDFVLDLDSLPAPPESSWMQPGATFVGHQHANNGSNALPPGPQGTATHSRINFVNHVVEQINPNYRQPTSSSSALNSAAAPSLELQRSTSGTPQPFDATRPWLSHQFVPPTRHPSGMQTSTSRPSSSQQQQQPSQPPLPRQEHDKWPVRVVIHTVDRERMTLQGTMEAYDVPQCPTPMSIGRERTKAGNKASPITTYLEGQIIDLRTHGFLTPQLSDGSGTKQPSQSSRQNSRQHTATSSSSNDIPFPTSSTAIDASNWLKLPPFSQLALNPSPASSFPTLSSTMARTLLSLNALAQLQQQYVFMRWKERCFVHSRNEEYGCDVSERGGDQDRGHGLTISGFYYVALNRATGVCDGLYFDPASTPWQCLRLQGTAGKLGVGSWEFR